MEESKNINEEKDLIIGKKRIQSETELSPSANIDKTTVQVCITGINRYTKAKDIHKYLETQYNPPINYIGISKKKNMNVAFILLSNQEEKERLTIESQQKKLKNRIIRVKPAKTLLNRSNFQSKEKIQERIESMERESKIEIGKNIYTNPIPITTSLIDQVLPLHKLTYKEQLNQKKKDIETLITKFESGYQNNENIYTKIKYDQTIKCSKGGRIGYRNKAEFSIGHGINGELEIGFIQGKMRDKNIFISPPNTLTNISAESILVVNLLKPLITNSNREPYNRITCEGFWRSIQVRQSASFKQIMVTIIVSSIYINNINEGCERNNYEYIRDMFKEIMYYKCTINEYELVSFCLIESTSKSTDFDLESDKPIYIFGEGNFQDQIHGYKFQISPLSFFQINHEICERMYNIISEYTEIDSETIIFDICCGAGTIGICLSKIVQKVIGFEITPSAIEDAIRNSILNGVEEKCKWILGKAEDKLPEVARKYEGHKIIGIVDPPRGGLHPLVLKALRRCRGLDTLVYVSCNPTSMVDNLGALCLPMTKQRKAPPFWPLRYSTADLFPYTTHLEAIMLLKRTGYI